jgi:hypothetical protein
MKKCKSTRAFRIMRSGLIVLVVGGVLGPPACVSPLAASSVQAAEAPAGYFPTLPPHAALPSAAACASAVLSTPASAELRPANAAANHTVPTPEQLTAFHAFPVKGSFVPRSDFVRVDGQFTGTTDQILRWGACKWGVDEDVVRAEAAAESHWLQSAAGDTTTDFSLCPPGAGFPGAWNGAQYKQSYGIMQMKYKSFGGWPLSKDSTAFNVDFRLAYQRACMNGDISYLPQRIPASGYPRYPDGTPDEMMWGCMGDWFSGSWYDPGALKYIAAVKLLLAPKGWLRGQF